MMKEKVGVIHPGMMGICVAATFREAGLPGEFHAAAEMIYQRIAGFKDASETPALEEVLEMLAHPPEK